MIKEIFKQNLFKDKIIKCCGYNITFNHSELYDLEKRIKERTNLTIEEFLLKARAAFKKAIEYALTENRKEMVIYFTKSKFIMILRITRKTKNIYVKTILAKNMKYDGYNIKLDVNEALKILNVNENIFTNLDYGFFEPNDGLFIDKFLKFDL